jgi:hypothetical protein
MTHERAAALAAARRSGLSLDQVAGHRFTEVALESEDARRRAETVSEADGAAADESYRRFLAQHAPPQP